MWLVNNSVSIFASPLSNQHACLLPAFANDICTYRDSMLRVQSKCSILTAYLPSYATEAPNLTQRPKYQPVSASPPHI